MQTARFARSFLTLSALALCALSARPAAQLRQVSADVRMTHLAITVEIVDGVASTMLRQTWRNDGPRQAEATWLLPLPEGAVADGFTLSIDGAQQSGEVLDEGQARGIYEAIVRGRRDPGLLEYYGRGCLRARIFPIPPSGESVVEVGYRAILPERLGMRAWTFALAAAGAGGLAPEQVVLDLSIRSRKAIKNAFSPEPAVHVVQKDDHAVRASFEGPAARLAGKELAVYHGLSEAEFGLDLLSHRGADAAEGTFLMLISPRREWQAKETLKKSIVFVLDTSGSMEGAKIAQAREALKTFLGSLDADDRFDVVPFSTEPEPFFGQRVPASAENVAEALERVERVTAAGGTNIHAALEVALRGESEAGRVPILVFLTDGEPTVGETAPEAILAAVRAANGLRTRLFVMGVGDQVNTHLLDYLAEQNGGARDYVRTTERIDEKTRALFAKLSHPVMTDLALSVDGLAPTQIVPAKLPDLFAGDRLEVLGRYAGRGAHAIRLTGMVSGERREYVYEGTFADAPSPDFAFVAPLWAERRVGVLLDAIRLNGSNPELIAEVTRLGREYRIVTPYTSHLVVEPNMRRFARSGGPTGPMSPGPPTLGGAPGAQGAASDGADGFFLGHGARPSRASLEDLAARLSREGVLPEGAAREELAALASQVARELRDSEQRLRGLGKTTSGTTAVDDSQYLAGLMSGEPAQNGRLLLELFTRRAGDKTFVLRKGIWVDQACGEEPAAERRRIEAFSPEYFRLVAEHPELAAYLALSSRLILKLGDETLEIHVPAPAEAPAPESPAPGEKGSAQY